MQRCRDGDAWVNARGRLPGRSTGAGTTRPPCCTCSGWARRRTRCQPRATRPEPRPSSGKRSTATNFSTADHSSSTSIRTSGWTCAASRMRSRAKKILTTARTAAARPTCSVSTPSATCRSLQTTTSVQENAVIKPAADKRFQFDFIIAILFFLPKPIRVQEGKSGAVRPSAIGQTNPESGLVKIPQLRISRAANRQLISSYVCRQFTGQAYVRHRTELGAHVAYKQS